jgi:hypothetical protein
MKSVDRRLVGNLGSFNFPVQGRPPGELAAQEIPEGGRWSVAEVEAKRRELELLVPHCVNMVNPFLKLFATGFNQSSNAGTRPLL